MFLLLTVAAAEGLFQVAALLVDDRAGTWPSAAEVRILAVGDSHTYGPGVLPEESYPAQLQAFLEEQAPGRFSVMNLGVPGMSTSQVWNRLRVHVARYEPDVVIVWCGVNDAWNRADLRPLSSAWRSWLDGIVWRSRLYRFLRVWQHSRSLERVVHGGVGGGLPQRMLGPVPETERGTRRLAHGGYVDEIRHERGGGGMEDEVGDRSYRNYRQMAAWLGAAGIELVLVMYPLDFGAFHAANRAMERVAQEAGIALVDSRAVMARVPEQRRAWLPGAHPNAAIYREIAREIVPKLLAGYGPGP